MEKRILKVLAGCAILGVLMFASCRKLDKLDNLKVVNYDAEFAIPLFKAKASFDDILEGCQGLTWSIILLGFRVQFATEDIDADDDVQIVPVRASDELRMVN